ncbi:MAG: hypothetical protein ACLUFT_12145 [Gemmiger formicilis]|uniref:hypothetical protein n=1 Tax=Gemmiger formicilis TaxID=745368 RepID=UPI00399451D4
MKVFNLQTDNTFPLDGRATKQRLAGYRPDKRGGLNIGQNVICVALLTEVFNQAS